MKGKIMTNPTKADEATLGLALQYISPDGHRELKQCGALEDAAHAIACGYINLEKELAKRDKQLKVVKGELFTLKYPNEDVPDRRKATPAAVNKAVSKYKRVLGEARDALSGLRLAYVDVCGSNNLDYHKWQSSWNAASLDTLTSIQQLTKEST